MPMFWLQPLVPTVAAADGRWMVSEPLTVVLKPGGHGVIWKLASDDGVFDWLSTQGRKAAIVRQIRYASRTSTIKRTLWVCSGLNLKGPRGSMYGQIHDFYKPSLSLEIILFILKGLELYVIHYLKSEEKIKYTHMGH